MSSGPRPKTPPGLKMSSIVRSFLPCGEEPAEGVVCAIKSEVVESIRTARVYFTSAPGKVLGCEKVYQSRRARFRYRVEVPAKAAPFRLDTCPAIVLWRDDVCSD